MNVLLLCGNLSYAGAQRQLFELAKGLNKNHQVIVCSITSKVPTLDDFQKNGIRVEVLGLRKKNLVKVSKRLLQLYRENSIEIVYSFLDTANLYSRLTKILKPSIKVVSSERSSDIKASFSQKLAEMLFSKMTNLYITNSYAGKQSLIKNYGVGNVLVIHNGIDRDRFSSVKTPELDFNYDDKVLIAMIGRIKPDKNYEMFLSVAEKVCDLHPEALFIAVGDQITDKDSYHEGIFSKRDRLKNKERILFIGARSDIPDLLSITDISMLTSHREGCSNTVLESMFSKCPLTLTDVGDNKIVVSDANKEFITAPDGVDQMVDKISLLIKDKELRNRLGAENYSKAHKEFTTEQMILNTEAALLQVITH